MTSKQKWVVGALCSLPLFILSCAPETVDVTECVTNDSDHFWMGLWHGIICPVTFFISLFDHSVSIYSVNNNGHWYDLGFVIGIGGLFGGGSASRK